MDTTNDRVGVGTSTPATNLHLVGVGTGLGPRLRFETLNNGNSQYTTGGTEIGGIQFGADDYGWSTQHMSSEIVGIHDTPNYSGARGILAFKTSSSQGSNPAERMRIRYDGNVGIGLTNPLYPLDVSGSSYTGPPSGVFGYYLATAEVTNVGAPYDSYSQNISIRASQNMIAVKFQTYSDRRIKKNITEIRDDEALIKLRKLKPCKYNYIDTVARGNGDVYGFIAQEVGSILPEAAGTHTGYIPNIYDLASVSESNKITFNNNYKTSNLEANSVIQVVTTDNKREQILVSEVIDEDSIRVEEDLSPWISDTGKLFVYGQEVDDFTHLDKNTIWTVATAALQEVDRQLQAEKEKVRVIDDQLQAEKEKTRALEDKVEALEDHLTRFIVQVTARLASQ